MALWHLGVFGCLRSKSTSCGDSGAKSALCPKLPGLEDRLHDKKMCKYVEAVLKLWSACSNNRLRDTCTVYMCTAGKAF
jgi:hypothetical protein